MLVQVVTVCTLVFTVLATEYEEDCHGQPESCETTNTDHNDGSVHIDNGETHKNWEPFSSHVGDGQHESVEIKSPKNIRDKPVNFVLYNQGASYSSHPGSKIINSKAKLQLNCILIVAASSKCLGWSATATNSKENKTQQDFQNVDEGFHITPSEHENQRRRKRKRKLALRARNEEPLPYTVYLIAT